MKKQDQITNKNNSSFLIPHFSFLIVLFSLLIACSFDYGDLEPVESTMPNLVMENVDYVRVRSADPITRFQANLAERYEKQSIMKLDNITFEQFGSTVEDVNALGNAGSAVVEIDSGNVLMDNGVRIEVESEEIIIETITLQWNDEARTLFTKEDGEVNISRPDGTSFMGTGFLADARNRRWEFTGVVGGEYIFVEDEEEEEEGSEGSEGSEGREGNEVLVVSEGTEEIVEEIEDIEM